MPDKPLCFVVQGFGLKTDFTNGRELDLDASYAVIKGAVEVAGLRCVRADEILQSGTIDLPMYEHLLRAELVIADLSTYNVNAAFELGVRYGLRPRATIIVCENQFKNPFDVSHIVLNRYEHLGKDVGVREAQRFSTELTKLIQAVRSNSQPDSPVYTFLTKLHPPVDAAQTTGAAATLPAAERTAGAEPRDQSAKQMLDLARRAINASDFIQAKALLEAAHVLRPNDVYIVQQLALATYKSRAPDAVTALLNGRTLLKDLGPDTTNDPETLGLWGAVHKRLWELGSDMKVLDVAIDAYERGFYLKQDYYNGINLAFLFNVRATEYARMGDRAQAFVDFVLARRVRESVIDLTDRLLGDGEEKSVEDRYWILATRWEAAFGLGDSTDASRWEERTLALGAPAWMLESTKTQLGKLAPLLALDPVPWLK